MSKSIVLDGVSRHLNVGSIIGKGGINYKITRLEDEEFFAVEHGAATPIEMPFKYGEHFNSVKRNKPQSDDFKVNLKSEVEPPKRLPAITEHAHTEVTHADTTVVQSSIDPFAKLGELMSKSPKLIHLICKMDASQRMMLEALAESILNRSYNGQHEMLKVVSTTSVGDDKFILMQHVKTPNQ